MPFSGVPIANVTALTKRPADGSTSHLVRRSRPRARRRDPVSLARSNGSGSYGAAILIWSKPPDYVDPRDRRGSNQPPLNFTGPLRARPQRP